MIAQWLLVKAPILVLESSDLQVDRICLELALDSFFVVCSDPFEALQEVNFDQAWLVLVPAVVLDRSELHRGKIESFTV